MRAVECAVIARGSTAENRGRAQDLVAIGGQSLRADRAFLLTSEWYRTDPLRFTPLGLLTNGRQRVSSGVSGFRRSLLVLVIALSNVAVVDAIGEGQSRIGGRTTTVHWDKVPLGDALARLETTLGEPIFTDRRVDPNNRISLDIVDAASDDVLAQAAAAASLGTSRLVGLVYFGPTGATSQLRTLAAIGEEEIARLPAKLRSAAKVKQAVDWSRLAEPRQLVTKLVEGRGLRLDGAEKIPHNL
jgi:hypothetical protein